MKITGRLPKTADRNWPRAAVSRGAGATKPSDIAARRFDSVTISQESGFLQEMRSRLTQEVRTAPSKIEDGLQAQIQEGLYRPDPAEIARKMLLLGEVTE